MSGIRLWSRLVPIALLVTALLAGIVTWSRSGGIEQDLTSRSQAALAAAGLSSGQVTFDGRDATLRGFPANQAQRALQIVQDVQGVRVAETSGDIAAAAPTTGGPATTADAAPSTTESTPATSAPSEPPATTSTRPTDRAGLQAEVDRVVAAAPITFQPDSAKLTPEGESTARELARVFADAPDGVRFRISGHVARGPGGEKAALKLSQDRARAVARLLEAGGVPAKQVVTKGFGDSKPTSAGEDRRVEITVEQG
ncbi:OmpA family protein [Amycolatopsis sp. H20-H5]|uniref:OmpA family protein n=1 Tax=Amycolatopsis sp. H20-H5 TaxID=3046309 RepID=UPI002DBAD87C|nr:OmpA family protein [Amycolatopsis sp. H20-H5]MEC3982279.1 OmpA family protein [Amycolatopsis sp. H20-H5]